VQKNLLEFLLSRMDVWTISLAMGNMIANFDMNDMDSTLFF